MNNSTLLNRFFTRGVIGELVQNGTNDIYNAVVRRYINDPESKSHGEIISEIYARMGKEKRNEYFYLNTLLNKLLVKVHSVKTTTALSQIWIGKSKADFVMINGAGKVYEIKSEIDNFGRLASQLRDYYKAFGYVSVVAAAYEFDKIERALSLLEDIGDCAGIYALTDKNTESKKFSKEAKLCNDFLDHACIFRLLHKREYESVIKSRFAALPEVKQVFHYQACLERFSEIPILIAQKLAFRELRKRNRITKSDFERVPDPLKSVVYFSELSHDLSALTQVLKIKYRGAAKCISRITFCQMIERNTR